MFCTNCGNEINDGALFCTKCGNKIVNKNDNNNNNVNITQGSVIFARQKQAIYGVAVPIKVYLDGVEVASLKNGAEIKVPASIGKHRVAFNLWSGNGQYDIEVTNEHPNIKVSFKLCFGLLQSEPTITSIENV